MMKRVHIIYSGWVQGVGFRFTAERIASSLGLCGWIKNLRDGRVETVCEGNESAIKDFMERIDSTFKAYIHDKRVEWSDGIGEYTGFDITFD